MITSRNPRLTETMVITLAWMSNVKHAGQLDSLQTTLHCIEDSFLSHLIRILGRKGMLKEYVRRELFHMEKKAAKLRKYLEG